MHCKDLQTRGQAKILGNLTIQEAYISRKLFGQKKIFSSGQFHISSSLSCEQKIEMGQLMVSGSVNSLEGIQVEQVHVSEQVKAKDIKVKETSISVKTMIENDCSLIKGELVEEKIFIWIIVKLIMFRRSYQHLRLASMN